MDLRHGTPWLETFSVRKVVAHVTSPLLHTPNTYTSFRREQEWQTGQFQKMNIWILDECCLFHLFVCSPWGLCGWAMGPELLRWDRSVCVSVRAWLLESEQNQCLTSLSGYSLPVCEGGSWTVRLNIYISCQVNRSDKPDKFEWEFIEGLWNQF